MEFPFKEGVEYLSKAELRHFNKFMENEPLPKNLYKNSKGEERLCTRVDYPRGVQTSLTVKFIGKDEEVFYHTPCATVEGSMAKISYKENGSHGQCFSDEWLKWVGSNCEIKEYDPTESNEKERKKTVALLEMIKRSEKNQEKDDFTKEGNWKPLRKEK